MLAVIVVVPGPTAVARPDALTVATEVALDVHATMSVTSLVVEGWLPWVVVAVALNCAVCPAVKD
jgi:hypothetical protein